MGRLFKHKTQANLYSLNLNQMQMQMQTQIMKLEEFSYEQVLSPLNHYQMN